MEGSTVRSRTPYWTLLAKSYVLARPPLLPSPEDIHAMEEALAKHARAGAAFGIRALMLGVTPAIAGMNWPPGASVAAADASIDMIRALWTYDPSDQRAVTATWTALPLRSASCDVVVGDGSLNCLPHPGPAANAMREVARVLRPGGLFLHRCYVRQDPPETPQQVVDDLVQGRIATFPEIKFRLLVALQRSTEEGLAVRDVYEFWRSLDFDWNSFAHVPGWEPELVATMANYKDSPTVYAFPNLAEWRGLFVRCFHEVSLRPASYRFGDQCPLLVLRRCGDH
jgi:SAM-dependent methyltransferase